jgi:hypothetical protein
VVLAALGALGVSWALPGCAGRSTGSDGGSGSGAAGGAGGTGGTGGTGGAGGRGGTAGRAGSGQGETGGSAGRGASGGRAGSGSGGSAGTATSPDDCIVNGDRVASGTKWTEDCNTCWCESSKVECTLVDCGSAGGSGRAGSGGAGGASGAGSGGAAGEPSCADAEIGSFCVVGNPISSGDQVVAGMPLRLRLQPRGCHSSSCTKVDSSWCSYLADGNDYWVSAGLCLRQEGDVCTEDCGGGSAQCETGTTLSAGVNTVSIPGTELTVTFTVPSVAMGDELCAGAVER